MLQTTSTALVVVSIAALGVTGGASLSLIKPIKFATDCLESSMTLMSDAVDIHDAVERNDDITGNVVVTTVDAVYAALNIASSLKKQNPAPLGQAVKDALVQEVNAVVSGEVKDVVREKANVLIGKYITKSEASKVMSRLSDSSNRLEQMIIVRSHPEDGYVKEFVHCKYAYDRRYAKFSK